MRQNKGLTLIEMLIVIVVIAIILSIFCFWPRLEKPKDPSRVNLCSYNMRQQLLGMTMYANGNDQKYYTYSGKSSSPRELTFENTWLLRKYAGIKTDEIFSCPIHNNSRSFANPRLWQYSLNIDKASPGYKPKMVDEQADLTEQQRKENYRLMDYVYLLDKTDPNDLSIYTDKDITWYNGKNVTADKTGETPVIIDIICRDKTSDKYSEIPLPELSKWGLTESTSHISRTKTKPAGGNHAYADGHITWINFSELTENYTRGDQVYYWRK